MSDVDYWKIIMFCTLQALKMIHNIRDAFNELLEQNQWMDKDTKEVAKEKVFKCLSQFLTNDKSWSSNIAVSQKCISSNNWWKNVVYSLMLTGLYH